MYIEDFIEDCIDIRLNVNAFSMQIQYLTDEHWECYFSLVGSLKLDFVPLYSAHYFRVIIDKDNVLTLVYERSDIERIKPINKQQ